MNKNAKPLRILVLTSWSFKDGLIQSSTLPYLRMLRGLLPEHSVLYLVTFEQRNYKVGAEEKKAIQKALELENIRWIGLPYLKFGLLAMPWYFAQLIHVLFWACIKKIDRIHAFCPPAGVLGYAIAKLTGKELVLDSYEPHAESMVENGTWRRNGWRHRFLLFMEKRMSASALAVIALTEGMKTYAYKTYGVPLANFYVRPTCVDMELFDGNRKSKDPLLMERLNLQGKVICVYAGKFGAIYLEQETIEFVKCCHRHWGDRFVFLLITAHTKEDIKQAFERQGADYSVVRQFFVPHQEVPRYMGLADFAISPVKPVPSKKYCSPIKDGEYWAMGLPVVIPQGISDDSEIIEKEHAGYVLKKLDLEEYEKAVQAIEQLLAEDRRSLRQRIMNIASRYRSYAIARTVYRSMLEATR